MNCKYHCHSLSSRSSLGVAEFDIINPCSYQLTPSSKKWVGKSFCPLPVTQCILLIIQRGIVSLLLGGGHSCYPWSRTLPVIIGVRSCFCDEYRGNKSFQIVITITVIACLLLHTFLIIWLCLNVDMVNCNLSCPLDLLLDGRMKAASLSKNWTYQTVHVYLVPGRSPFFFAFEVALPHCCAISELLSFRLNWIFCPSNAGMW